MTKSNYTSIDVEGHDGSAAGLYLGGTLVTATATELNSHTDYETQLLVANGAITIKNGVCRIAKTVAGVVAATLADPVATTDDYKVLVIINYQAQSNTVTSGSSFGGGGGGEDVATFTNTIGNTLSLMAYQGKWYIVGKTGVAIA
jgi:hypothetical protein